MLDVTEEDLESVTIFHLFDLTCVPHQCVKNAISYGKKDQVVYVVISSAAVG